MMFPWVMLKKMVASMLGRLLKIRRHHRGEDRRGHRGKPMNQGSCRLSKPLPHTDKNNHLVPILQSYNLCRGHQRAEANQTKRTATQLGAFHLCLYQKVYQQNAVRLLERCLWIAAVWYIASTYRTFYKVTFYKIKALEDSFFTRNI